MSVFLCRLCLSIAICLHALPALAEQRTVDLARESYVQGLEAARNVRWSDAVEHFRHSYELSHTTAALYNLGVALRALGRHREARDTFDVLLHKSPDLDGVTRENAQKLRTDASERVVELHIGGFDPEGAYEVLVDGMPNAVSNTEKFTLEVDEGRHSLSVHRGSRTMLRWTGAVRAGAPIALELERDDEREAEPVAGPVAARTEEPEELAEPSFLPERERAPNKPPERSRRGWWWAGGGAAVAAAVAGVLVYALRRPEPRTVDAPDNVPVVPL